MFKQNWSWSKMVFALAFCFGMTSQGHSEGVELTNVVRIMDSQQFCKNLINTFAHSSLTANQSQRSAEASRLANNFLLAIKRDKTLTYLSLADLGINPAAFPSKQGRVLSVVGVLEGGLGQRGDVTLVRNVADLKYLPYSIDGISLLILVDEASTLTQDRAQLVASVANRKKINISVVWSGEATNNNAGPTNLAYLTKMTGGAFLDLNSLDQNCGAAQSNNIEAAKVSLSKDTQG